MQFSFLKDLKAFLQESYNVELPELEFSLCPADFQGDITVSCFPLAKMLRKNPMQIAQQVLEYLEKHEDIEAVEAIKAFVNVSLKAAALMRDTVEDEKALDRYEGYPRLYCKENLEIEMNGVKHQAMIYLMNDGLPSMPTKWYLDAIAQGYEDIGLDTTHLAKALEHTKERMKEKNVKGEKHG